MVTNSKRKELGHFLQTRRKHLDPSDFGIAIGTGRRTPGLRREELAQVAGVGLSWYTWLEQGREINVSPQVLDSISRALQLDWVERRHLFNLALDLHVTPHTPQSELVQDPTLQGVLDSWVFSPAYAVDRNWNVVGWNSLARLVFTDFSKLVGRDRNLVWYSFTNPEQRQLVVNWEMEAKKCIALFRESSDQYADSQWFGEFIRDLTEASPEFREWWPLHELLITHGGIKELNHPKAGKLFLRPTILLPAELPDLRILLFTPLSQANTLEKLKSLASGEEHEGIR